MSAPTQRYEVIERLDAGGMAEVFRGRSTSIEGFEKQVAIKRVLPHLAKNEKFVNMFLDEAKLSLYLNHANIVQVFDLGRAADTYFIVMEYVEGANLKRVIEETIRGGDKVPVPLAAYIALEVCKGLSYAHEKTDPSGRDLGIVHRDISPPNILISNQGEVKITDFGLAKARSQLEETDPGVVKGKFGYLAPEAAKGGAVDALADIFAVGIVFWEMLAGRRLFLGETDYATLDQVRAAKVPPLRNFNEEVTPELELLVRRALAREPSERFQTAREMGTAISRLLATTSTSVTSYDLAQYIEDTLGDANTQQGTSSGSSIDRVIQDEIDRLISIDHNDSAAAQNPRETSSPVIEDPRTWGFDDDFGELGGGFEDNPSRMDSGAYARVGGTSGATSEAVPTRIRTAGTHTASRGARGPDASPVPEVRPDAFPPRSRGASEHVTPAPNGPPPRPATDGRAGKYGARPKAGTRRTEAIAPPEAPEVEETSGESKVVYYVLLFAVLGLFACLIYLVIGG